MWVSRSAHAAKGNGISNMKTWMSEDEGLLFVGRTEQLERLSEAMDTARNGRVQTVSSKARPVSGLDELQKQMMGTRFANEFIEREFDTPRELVFEAYKDADLFAQ